MWTHTEAVYKNSRATGSARSVLLYLAHRANEKGQCWPSQVSIADETGISRRTVIRAIQELADMGEIDIVEQGGGRGNSTLYYLKGCHGVTVSDNIKGDTAAQKGDTAAQKGDTAAQKGDTAARKGDTVSPQYINKDQERSEEIYIPRDAPPMHSGIRYESEPPEPEYDPVALDEMKTAINSQVKDRMINTRREDELEALALDFLEQGITLDEVSGFAGWWEVNGYYNGLPAFKSFETEWANYRRGVQTASDNGSEPKRHSTLERLRMQIMEESV